MTTPFTTSNPLILKTRIGSLRIPIAIQNMDRLHLFARVQRNPTVAPPTSIPKEGRNCARKDAVSRTMITSISNRMRHPLPQRAGTMFAIPKSTNLSAWEILGAYMPSPSDLSIPRCKIASATTTFALSRGHLLVRVARL